MTELDGIGNGFAGIGVVLVNNEIGPLLILNGDLGSLAGEQLHMVLPEVDDMIGGGSGFLHRTYYSDANGQFKLDLLRDGWYRVTELEPAAGFTIKQPATQEFYIKGGEMTEPSA